MSWGGNIYGNLDLSFEKLVNYEMGIYYDVSCDLLFLSIVFYNEFEDKIICILCLFI